MIINIPARFVLLSLPKSASTAMDTALKRHSSIWFKRHAKLKHLNYRDFTRLIVPLLTYSGLERHECEVVCIMRDPAQWLSSWYRYLRRPSLEKSDHKHHKRHLGDMTFEQFLERRLAPDREELQSNQLKFLLDRRGNVGVDRLFRLEDGNWKEYFRQKIGQPLDFPHKNVTSGTEIEVPDLRSRLPLHYELYDGLTTAGEVPARFRTLTSRKTRLPKSARRRRRPSIDKR